ncbi:dihydrofolate reductase family protein [candidate division KSB1 bacterium]|nr:dihydrofolate reductase family protein [candidate division KSB1 bacterium]
MRKIKLQVQLSVDGFVAGPQGEMDWMQWNWDDQLKKNVNELTDSIDTILLGRKMAIGFISHWSNVMANPNDPDYPFARRMVDTPKVVFSKTLNKSEWQNTVIANGNLFDEIQKLKAQPGKDIIVYGGSGFVASLIEKNLIDEYHLYINPAIIGKGMTIFADVGYIMNLKMVGSKAFDCGIVENIYVPNRD